MQNMGHLASHDGKHQAVRCRISWNRDCWHQSVQVMGFGAKLASTFGSCFLHTKFAFVDQLKYFLVKNGALPCFWIFSTCFALHY